jgi:hypothetical protein
MTFEKTWNFENITIKEKLIFKNVIVKRKKKSNEIFKKYIQLE